MARRQQMAADPMLDPVDFAEAQRRYEQARREAEIEREAKGLVEQLGRFANGMSGAQRDAFSNALANQHPTLIGQLAKAVGVGVVRRAQYDPEWKPFDPIRTEGHRLCTVRPDLNLEPHDDHDGRLDCTTVVGARLMAQQSFT
jgi:hypothetical protein